MDEDGFVSFLDVIENVSMMVIIYKQLAEQEEKAREEELQQSMLEGESENTSRKEMRIRDSKDSQNAKSI